MTNSSLSPHYTHPLGEEGETRRPVQPQGTTCYQNSLPRTRTEVIGLWAGVSVEHEWKDAKKCLFLPDRSPTVHVGKLPIHSSRLYGSRGHRPRPGTHGVAETNRGPIPSKTSSRENPLQEWGLQAQKKYSRRPGSRGRRTLSLHNGRIPNFPSWMGNGYPKTPPLVLRSRTAPSRIVRSFGLRVRLSRTHPRRFRSLLRANPGAWLSEDPTRAYSSSDVSA
jgi:hypothetical protein